MQEGRPSIIIDPGLHRVVKSFDIDIDAYTQYLYMQGLSSDQINSLTVCFTPVGRFLSGGIYNFKTHKMQISVPRARNVNQLLVHETHHAVEGMLGQISNADRSINRIFNVGVYAGIAVLALSAVWNTLSGALYIRQLASVLHDTFALGTILFLVGGIAYVFNPAERRAYAVKTPKVPFVCVVKKSFWQQLIGLMQVLVISIARTG